jgi:hypothetical protein
LSYFGCHKTTKRVIYLFEKIRKHGIAKKKQFYEMLSLLGFDYAFTNHRRKKIAEESICVNRQGKARKTASGALHLVAIK